MQTFLPYPDAVKTAECLDNKRLGKQRVEAIQIANILLDRTKTKGWRNHPAVLMWKGYEGYLIFDYLKIILDEWNKRGYKNHKCAEHYLELWTLWWGSTNFKECLLFLPKPEWITSEFCRSHQSNLVRKNPEHYRKYFPNVPDNLPYVWPV